MDNKYIKKSVVNHSSFELNDTHLSLLSRGLKFCPTPNQPNTGDLKGDLDKLHKNMRWTSFFNDIDNDSPDQTGQSFHDQNTATIDTEPFYNIKFKLKSGGKGPIGPQI